VTESVPSAFSRPMPQVLSESGPGNAYPFCAGVIRFVQEIRSSLSERSASRRFGWREQRVRREASR
jgi:hypothetical protein